MKVILLERVGRYGTIGDEVNVKNGYARNFLLPAGKALRSTDANRARFEADRAVIEKRNEERRDEAAGIASGLNGHAVVMVRQAAETGQLYGSVSSRDIAEALANDGFMVARSQVDLVAPIKTVGLHSIALKLHAEVDVTVTINVARTSDEAERQLAGEDMMVVNYDDEDQAPVVVEEEDGEEAEEGAAEEVVADAEETERQEDA